MCDSPVKLLNPNYIHRNRKGIHRNESKLSYIHDTTYKYIFVPCGVCDSCRRLAQVFMVQRFREHIKGKFAIFCTATYSNEAIPHLGTYNNTTGESFDLLVPAIDDFRLMVKRIRRYNLFSRPFTYWCTTEYGGKRHRPHFHYFIFVEKRETDNWFTGEALAREWELVFRSQWKRKVGGTRFNPQYLPLSKFIKKPDGTGTYDVHLCTSSYGKSEDMSDVIFYASKYCLKFDFYVRKRMQAMHETMDYADYQKARKQFRPRILCSKGFGISPDTSEFVRDCINYSLKHSNMGFCYYNPNGDSYPLARYYKRRFLTVDDVVALMVKQAGSDLPDDNSHDMPVFDKSTILNLERKHSDFVRMCKRLEHMHDDIIIDD